MIRGYKVMLDADLAELYSVENKHLKRQVKRNIDRFPEDFMFELTTIEQDALRYQFGTLKRGEHSKYTAFAFTEQGVAMLSSVLNSKHAIQVNIRIMRIFTQLRQMLFDNTELRLAIEEIRRKTENNTKNIEVVFKYLDELIEKKENPTPMEAVGYKISPKNRI
jgi:cell division protein FtsL